MTAVALALHIFGAVVWVGGMFAIYVCLRPALGALEPPQRLRLMRVTFEKFFPWVWLAASSGREANEVSANGANRRRLVGGSRWLDRRKHFEVGVHDRPERDHEEGRRQRRVYV